MANNLHFNERKSICMPNELQSYTNKHQLHDFSVYIQKQKLAIRVVH